MTKAHKNDSHLRNKTGGKVPSLSSIEHPFWDFWGPILMTLSLYIGIRHYIAEARYIPSGSMLPGLKVHDRLLIEKLSYRYRSPSRGEIVVFNSPFAFDTILNSKRSSGSFQCAFLNIPIINIIPGLSNPACDAYIKRVVAISGDTIHVTQTGKVIVNNKPLKESYVKQYCSLGQNGKSDCLELKTTVPDKHVLVLGDNRSNSWDSRFWPGGPFLPEGEILGRAIWRFWPINRLGALHL